MGGTCLRCVNKGDNHGPYSAERCAEGGPLALRAVRTGRERGWSMSLIAKGLGMSRGAVANLILALRRHGELPATARPMITMDRRTGRERTRRVAKRADQLVRDIPRTK